MKALNPPKFKSEDEEAQWWYDNRAIIEANAIEVLRSGKAQRLTKEMLLDRLRGERIVVPPTDSARARKLSHRKKIDTERYILSLIHKALDREEAALKRAARRKTA